MLLIYNFLLTTLFLLLLPVFLLIVTLREKYRGRTLERLGLRSYKFKKQLVSLNRSGPVIWLHALSVGEVTSALPLVKAIRDEIPGVVLVVSVATRSGRQVADTFIVPHADLLLYSPFDLWFAVKKYITTLQPDLFILVETDFWPCWLRSLQQQHIPSLLVNGRISERSLSSYRRLPFLFTSMFNCFTLLSMQTTEDREKMISLGISPEKIMTLGNLKYDIATGQTEPTHINRAALDIDAAAKIWVCGSTHPGEEEILFAAFQQLATDDRLFLILAPRDTSRGRELLNLASRFNLQARTRSGRTKGGNVLILDTVGELSFCYNLARLAFVGGSLVSCGGHNPIEPAACGVPVLFGRHMEDFSEIAHELQKCGGAKTVTRETLVQTAADILTSDERHDSMSRAGQSLVSRHRGGVTRHIHAIHRLLQM